MKHSIIDPIIHLYQRWINRDNIGKTSLHHRVIKGSFWSFAGTIISRGLGVITSIIVARFLGQVGYGELGIIVSTIGMFSAIGNLGLGLTATRYVAKLRSSDPKVAGRVAGLTIIMAILSYSTCSIGFFIFSPLLATKILKAPHLIQELRLVSIMLFLGGIDGVQIGILAGFEAFRAIARVSVIRGVINLPVSFLATWLFGLTGTVSALLIVAFISAWINVLAINRTSSEAGVHIRYGFDKSLLNLLWNFSLPTFLVSILSAPTTWVVNAMLVNQPNGYAEMGILSAATQWGAVVIFVPSVLSTAGVAIQSNLLGKGDQKTFRKLVFYNLIVQVGGVALITSLIILTAPWIMSLYGRNFSRGGAVLVLMSIGWIFMSVGSVFWDAMISLGRVWWGFGIKLISAFILLSAVWLLVGRGARGVAAAFICSYACFALLQVLYFIFKPERAQYRSNFVAEDILP